MGGLWERIVDWLDSGPGAATIAVGLLALVGVVTTVVTTYRVAGRTVYITSITAERSKWIDKLRTNLAAYSGLLAELSFALHDRGFFDAEYRERGDEIIAVLNRVNAVASVIQLQLNPWNVIDRHVLTLIDAVVIRRGTDQELVDRADKLLIQHSQWLLKAEWEKVKFEARGPVHRWWHADAERIRLNDYAAWAAKEGNLDDVVARFALERSRAATATGEVSQIPAEGMDRSGPT